MLRLSECGATDRAGRPVSGLAAKGFTRLDNGVAQKIGSFEASNQATNANERQSKIAFDFEHRRFCWELSGATVAINGAGLISIRQR